MISGMTLTIDKIPGGSFTLLYFAHKIRWNNNGKVHFSFSNRNQRLFPASSIYNIHHLFHFRSIQKSLQSQFIQILIALLNKHDV
ncbi:hypothetical protein D3C75_916260 [compost metagenome]